jgi:hypothetical protein
MPAPSPYTLRDEAALVPLRVTESPSSDKYVVVPQGYARHHIPGVVPGVVPHLHDLHRGQGLRNNLLLDDCIHLVSL